MSGRVALIVSAAGRDLRECCRCCRRSGRSAKFEPVKFAIEIPGVAPRMAAEAPRAKPDKQRHVHEIGAVGIVGRVAFLPLPPSIVSGPAAPAQDVVAVAALQQVHPVVGRSAGRH